MARSRRTLVLATSLALFLSVTTGAPANGRFPRAQQLHERDGDPERLVLAATYGLLLTTDRGGEWRHVCELGFAFTVAEIDPLVGLFPDGSMLVRGSRSLNRAPGPFCAFEPVLGGDGGETAVDFSLDPLVPTRVVALSMRRGGDGRTENQLFESTDSARTFTELGAVLPKDEVALGITLDLVPSDPNRVYVSATAVEGSGLFARSDDLGATWTTSPLSLETGEYAYIAAVHPTNPDVIYLRTDLWVPSADGVYAANDALFFSDDGGESFRELFRAPAKLFGFALSPDAADVLVGYGDPVEPSRVVDPAALGIYRARASDFAFEKIHDRAVSCLAWTDTGLYACTSQAELGYALGIASNGDFDFGTEDPFAPLLDLRTVRGPLDCPACTSAAECVALWPDTCLALGSCDAGGPIAGSGGTDCQSAGAGGSAGEPSTGSGGAGGGAREKRSPRESACGCRNVGAEKATNRLAPLALAFIVFSLRRLPPRSRRRSNGEPARPGVGNY